MKQSIFSTNKSGVLLFLIKSQWIGLFIIPTIWIGGCSYCYFLPAGSRNRLSELKNVQLQLLTKDNREITTRKYFVRNDTLFVLDNNIIKKGETEKVPLSEIVWLKCCELKGDRAKRTGKKFFLVLGSAYLILLLIRLTLPDNAFLIGG